jgi:hypothetical protein
MPVTNASSDLTAERVAEIRALRETTIASAAVGGDEDTALHDIAVGIKGRGGDPLSLLLGCYAEPQNYPPNGLCFSLARLVAHGGTQ